MNSAPQKQNAAELCIYDIIIIYEGGDKQDKQDKTYASRSGEFLLR